MNTSPKTAEALVESYLAAWNAEDDGARRRLVAETWTEDGHYVDPVAEASRHEGIAAMIGGVQARFPGMRFSRLGTVDSHNGGIRFSWSLGPDGGAAFVKGTDFGVVQDGRLRSVIGFFDQVPQSA